MKLLLVRIYLKSSPIQFFRYQIVSSVTNICTLGKSSNCTSRYYRPSMARNVISIYPQFSNIWEPDVPQVYTGAGTSHITNLHYVKKLSYIKINFYCKLVLHICIKAGTYLRNKLFEKGSYTVCKPNICKFGQGL